MCYCKQYLNFRTFCWILPGRRSTEYLENRNYGNTMWKNFFGKEFLDMKISDLLYYNMINIITKFQLYRIDREGKVMKFVCAKIDKIFQNLNFCKKLNRIFLTTSDQNLTIYGSLDSPWQNAYNHSIYMSLETMDQMLYANV